MVALAMVVPACSSSDTGPDEAVPADPAATASVEPSASPNAAGSGYDVVTIEEKVPKRWVHEPGPRPDVSVDLVTRMSDLGVELWQYQRAQEPEANVWVSPVSVYQALSMVAPGTGPEAIDELLEAMGLDAGQFADNPGDLADWIHASERSDYLMALYNAAFVAETYGGFAPAYLAAIEPIRDELGGFDPRDPQSTADLVNSRVEEHTRGMIDKLIAPGDISADLVTILVNATYFKGAWADPFDPLFTHAREFTLLDGTVVDVESMYQEMTMTVLAGDGYTAGVLPYEGGATAVLIVPDEGRLDQVAADLTASTLENLANAEGEGTSYGVGVPTFTSDTGIQELVPALRSLGVRHLFTPTPSWPMFATEDDHHISFVKHRVVVAVNELGTEAAAATSAGGIGGAGPARSFIVDRPFLMAILDADNAVLFMGQVTDPR
jgi:serpin B